MNQTEITSHSVIENIRLYLNNHRIIRDSLIHISLPYTLHDPLAIAEIIPKDLFSFFWERTDLDISMTCGDVAYELKAAYSDKETVFNQVTYWRNNTISFGFKDHSLSAPIFVGGMAFSEKSDSELWNHFGKLKLTAPKWSYIKNGQFALLNITVLVKKSDLLESIIDEIEHQIQQFSSYLNSLNSPTPESDKIHYRIVRETPFTDWEKSINRAKQYFEDETADKLVLARALDIEANRPIEHARFVNRLRNQYPSCYTFALHLPQGDTFLGSSPERLVSFHKNYILTEALAGTVSRGKSAKEDTYLEQQLLNSKKDLGEHTIVVSEILKRLEPFSNEIQIAEKPGIRKIANVQHLHTPITAWINHKTELLNLFYELHPTPAVGGYPKEVAKKIVPELEEFDRGWYAAPIGWFNLSGSGEFAVGIRSGIIQQNKARFYAGCGIVPDSDPLKEWDETKLKFMPMLGALEFA